MTAAAPAAELVDRLVARFGKRAAHRVLDVMLSQIPNVDLAALAYDWEGFWARPKQILPAHFRSFGFLTARGVGKTRALSSHIVSEVIAGRAMRIGMAAQNATKTIAVQVGGLLDASPPWCRPEWIATAEELRWPNGAVAYAYTPEVAGAIRSENLNLCWLSEVQSWPAATRREAYLNFQFATRIGYARTLWDATPKKRHPVLRGFLARAAADPVNHFVVGGTIHENARYLGAGVIESLEREFGGTQAGREELLGEMIEDSEAALVKQAWIDDHRRDMPGRLARRVLSIDPATTTNKGSDRTGIIDAGLGIDGQMLVIEDLSGKHEPPAWAAIVLDRYIRGACDLVIVETNKGGGLVTQNLRAAASERGLRVVVIGDQEPVPPRSATTVHVRERFAKGPKEDRARPLSTAYERGRVSHVRGNDLKELEEVLTTWEPEAGHRSPDALDALAHAAVELLGLLVNGPDPMTAFVGIEALGAQLEKLVAPVARGGGRSVTTLLGGGDGGGGRI